MVEERALAQSIGNRERTAPDRVGLHRRMPAASATDTVRIAEGVILAPCPAIRSGNLWWPAGRTVSPMWV